MMMMMMTAVMMMTVCDHENDDDDDAGGEHFLYLCKCWLSLHQGAVGPKHCCTVEGRQNRRRLTKHGKIGAVFVKSVVFNTSCVANFPSADSLRKDHGV